MKSWMRNGMIACVLVGLVPALAVAQRASEPEGADLEAALKGAATYDFGQSRESLTKVSDIVRAALPSVEASKAVAAGLAQFLGSDATLAAKQFVCRQLVIVGNADTVPALAALLGKDDTADMARYALERIPVPEADAALLAGLPKMSGKTKVGIINSLGERRTKDAVGPLSELAASGDADAKAAAVSALGKIGDAGAAKALEGLLQSAPPELHEAVADAYLACADQLLAAGQDAPAAGMYEKVYSGDHPANVRVAALHGLITSKGEAGVAIVLDVISGGDETLAALATGFIREIPGESVTKAFAAKLASMAPAVQIMMIEALADRGDKAALPAVMEAAKSEDEDIRGAAISALAKIGDASSVPVLAQAAASAEGLELKAARNSLATVRGTDVDAAMIAMVPKADAKMRAELIRGLAERNTTDAVPTLFETAKDADEDVREQSLKALGVLAAPDQLPALVALLVNAQNDGELKQAAKAVVAVSRKVPEENKRAAAVLAVYPAQKAANIKCVLLDVFGQLGDNGALQTLKVETGSADAEVKDAAVRSLTSWPNAAALQDSLELATKAESETHALLALRGALRMLTLPSDRSKADTIAVYEKALALCKRVDERRAALSGLADLGDPAALPLVEAYLSDEEVSAEAKQAVAKLRRSLYKAEASHNAGEVGKALDNNADTRWSSGASQEGGEWFLLDVGAECKVTKVILDSAKSGADYARGYEVYVSNDKANWGDAVAKGEGDKPVLEIACTPKTGRYVKVVQTGKVGDKFWSIHEIVIVTE